MKKVNSEEVLEKSKILPEETGSDALAKALLEALAKRRMATGDSETEDDCGSATENELDEEDWE